MVVYLSGFDITTVPISGCKNGVADCLSHLSEGFTQEERDKLTSKKNLDIEDFILQVTASIEASQPSQFVAYDMGGSSSKEEESTSTTNPDAAKITPVGALKQSSQVQRTAKGTVTKKTGDNRLHKTTTNFVSSVVDAT